MKFIISDSVPVNVYGETDYFLNGEVVDSLEGFGYMDNNGNIMWYDNYTPLNDEYHLSMIYHYENGRIKGVI